MVYLGGKSKIADSLAAIIKLNRNGRAYLEPFCGACYVTVALNKVDSDAPIFASDFLPDLIIMWQEVQKGWLPPTSVSEEEYRNLRRAEPSALRAFVGFCCSFSAKFFGGYARDKQKPTNFALRGYNSVVKKTPFLKDVDFSHKSYSEWTPHNMIIYCDPPYEGTTGYGGTKVLDYADFWDTMREWSKTNTVLISSYSAPTDFKVVWSTEQRLVAGLNNEKTIRVENLFSINENIILAETK